MRLHVAIVSAGLGLITAGPLAIRSASACSCPLNTLVSPVENSVDVPINAVVLFESLGAPAIFDETHGVAVPATAEAFSPRIWLVRPSEPLAANSTFRMDAGPPGAPVSRFTTGASRDDEPPTFAGLTKLGAEFTALGPSLPCRNSCWPYESLRRLRLEFEPPASDATVLLLQIDQGGGDAGAIAPIPIPLFRRYSQGWPNAVDNVGCGFGVPEFRPGDEICARLVAFDVAGHLSMGSPQICETVRACEPRIVQPGCGLSAECVPPANVDAGVDGASDADTDTADAGGESDAAPGSGGTGGSGGGAAGSGASAPGGGSSGGTDGGCSTSGQNRAPMSVWSRIIPLLAAGALMRRRRRIA
jgi:hypothetical protein